MGIYRQNIAPGPDCKVFGAPIFSLQEALLIKSVAREFLARYELTDVQPDAWYPMQHLLSLCRDIRRELGEESLYSIGRAIPYVIDVDPASLRNVEVALNDLNLAYYSVNQGSDIGSYETEKVGPDKYRMICNTPYDHTLDHGIIVSFVERAKGRQVWNVEMLPMETSPHENNRGVFEITRI
ncbi:MAG: hypothetical protein ACYTDT_10270 [Planctomycetota bacterium]|jgi:hypothetical protein